MKERGVDPGVATLLVSPGRSAWAIPGEAGKRWTVGDSAPVAGGRQLVFEGEDGFERLELSAQTATDLGLCRGSAADVSQVLRASERKAARPSTRTIASGLAEARRAVAGAAEAARLSVSQAGDLLKVRSLAKGGKIGSADYHRAAAACIAELDRAEAHLRRIDGIAAELPEVARQPPASKAQGAKRATAPDPLNAAVAACRKEIEKCREKAGEYATK
jgi:hypothetical protein